MGPDNGKSGIQLCRGLVRLRASISVSLNRVSNAFTTRGTSYPAVEQSSAVILFHPSMKDLGDSTVGNTVLDEINSQ